MAYFATASDGYCFDLQCQRCKYGEKSCPIAMVQTVYNYEADLEQTASNILNDLVQNDGTCNMFKMFQEDFEIKSDGFIQLSLFERN